MRKIAAGLAVVALISSATVAHARGGRTTAEDCEAGSADPDCPDDASSGKGSSSETPPKSGK